MNSSAFSSRVLSYVAVVAVAILLTSCAGAPVQEMSNARQAIAAAEQAGAGKLAPIVFERAKAYMNAAEAALQRGEYPKARINAIRARQSAMDALAAIHGSDGHKGDDG